MAQIVQAPPSIGERLGTGLGAGLSQGLQLLAEQKMKELASRQQQAQTKSFLQSVLPGRTESEYAQLASGPPELLSSFLKQELRRPEEEAYAQALSQLLGGEAPGVSPSQTPEVEQIAGETAAQPKPLKLPQRLNVQNATKLAELQLKREKSIRESQKELKPYLQGHAQDLKNAKTLYQKANSMLKLLEENKDKFPGGFKGTLQPSFVYRDPAIRKYIADANTLVTLLAGSRKGVPTNFKIKLEQLSKPELSQPIETQAELLRDIIKDTQNVFAQDEQIRKIRKENRGVYPSDLVERIAEFEAGNLNLPTEQKAEGIPQKTYEAEFERLPSAAELKGRRIEAPDGSILESNGKEWVRV